MKEENKIAHLTFIQQIIDRMSHNSFATKGWAIGVLVGIYAFAGDTSQKAVIVTLIPLLVLWILDAYYLSMERKYRKLYDVVRKKEEASIDFNMNTNDIKIEIKEAGKYSMIHTAFSKTTIPFYLCCIVATIIIYFVKF